jgi:hypothetical protein
MRRRTKTGVPPLFCSDFTLLKRSTQSTSMTKTFWAIAVALLAPAALSAQQAGLEEAVATITQDDYAYRIGVIAHDSMQGRDTPSPGLNKTAEWAASEFRRMGLRGGVEEGGFIQRYPLRSVTVDAEASGMDVGGARLSFGEDLLPLFGASAEGEATGRLALVSGSLGMDGAFGGNALAGAHVVWVLSADAQGIDRSMFETLGQMREAGALSVIITNSTEDERWASNARRSMGSGVQKGWGDENGGGEDAFEPLLQVRTQSLQEVLREHGVNMIPLQARAEADVEILVVEDLQVTVSQSMHSEMIDAPNVVAILEGSDPELKNEYVVFSGHMDHVGMGAPDANGDSIFNGADDDASGTVAVIEVAEAMASLPVAPKRSTLFLLVSGEEKGLWGSEWFAENPTVPLESMIADLNTDMVGRNWTDTIVAIGKEHSDLGETLNRVNGDHPELRMTAIDDVWPEERFYFRSDHYNFARKGVPVLFFFNGTHDDYHGRDDEPDRIDTEKAARIARLVFYLGVDIANAAERPKWNPESYSRIVSDR